MTQTTPIKLRRRSPDAQKAYLDGWNAALKAAAKACDAAGWSHRNVCCEVESKASNVILGLKVQS